jgi:hypothetical protein
VSRQGKKAFKKDRASPHKSHTIFGSAGDAINEINLTQKQLPLTLHKGFFAACVQQVRGVASAFLRTYRTMDLQTK